MNQPPLVIDGATVITYAAIGDGVHATGSTKHFVAGELLDGVAGLAIVAYQGEGGFYLLYCSDSWVPFTDTHHDSVEQAKLQAEFEFRGVSRRWVGQPSQQ